MPSPQDYKKAFLNFKNNVLNNKGHFGNDDQQGWTWLVLGDNPGGQFLYTTRSPPWGQRPLALIKNSDPEEFFARADWYRVETRIVSKQLWGGQATKFPFPIRGEYT